jgi:hypothetical protein
MKKLMSLVAAILFAGFIIAGPSFSAPECVEGYKYSLTIYTDRHLCLDIYEATNACNKYKAVHGSDCYIVHYDSEKGKYYIYWGYKEKAYFNM